MVSHLKRSKKIKAKKIVTLINIASVDQLLVLLQTAHRN
jgi:hypothetical protein